LRENQREAKVGEKKGREAQSPPTITPSSATGKISISKNEQKGDRHKRITKREKPHRKKRGLQEPKRVRDESKKKRKRNKNGQDPPQGNWRYWLNSVIQERPRPRSKADPSEGRQPLLERKQSLKRGSFVMTSGEGGGGLEEKKNALSRARFDYWLNGSSVETHLEQGT